MRELAPETVIDQRYQILSRIGSGGMADVYCAQDLQLGRKVALKLLYRRFAEDEEFVERFRREASSAAGLQHANVVGVYDRGEWDGTYYIAMEYLEGHTLKQLVQAQGPLEPALAIDIVIQILKAARFAHKRGVIHRDLKPHNVILDEEGRAKVTDFGIARAGASDMTETGSILGTAPARSPTPGGPSAPTARVAAQFRPQARSRATRTPGPSPWCIPTSRSRRRSRASAAACAGRWRRCSCSGCWRWASLR